MNYQNSTIKKRKFGDKDFLLLYVGNLLVVESQIVEKYSY